MRVSSYYNQVDIGDGTSLLYNGANLCMDLVPTEYCHRWSSSGDFSFLAPEEVIHLIARGHITEKSPQEEYNSFQGQLRHLVDKHNDTVPNRGILYLILNYQCNLACTYCFQTALDRQNVAPRMSPAFVDELFLKYLPELFPEVPFKNIRIILFGGEPLLPVNRETISRILEFVREHSMVVSTATNGTTLKKMSDLIGPGKIINVQITMDGDKHFHNKHRIPSSRKPTFETMIESIQEVIKRDAYAYIRVHTHPDNIDSLIKLIDYLEEENILGHPNVDVYFKPINGFNANTVKQGDVEKFRNLFQRVAMLTRSIPTNSFDNLKLFLDMKSRDEVFPPLRYCGLGSVAMRVIDANGDIYNCSEEQGFFERRVGILHNGKVEYFPHAKTLTKRHILNIPECLHCSIAMLCRGGCAHQALEEKGTIMAPDCQQNREYIAQSLKAYYLIRKDQ